MSENIDVHRGVKTREAAKKKSEGRERRVYKLGSTGECLLFQRSISEPVQAPHAAALTPPHKEVTDGVTESSLFQSGYKNNSLYLKEKKLRQKRPFFFFFFPLDRSPSSGTRARVHRSESSLSDGDLAPTGPDCTDPNQRRICGLHLALWLHSAKLVSVTPTDFTREHSEGLLHPIPGLTNLFPLKLHAARPPPPTLPLLTPHCPVCPSDPFVRN